jgi:hypothetical protein
MFRSFKKSPAPPSTPSQQEQIAGSIVARLLRLQSKWADFMGSYINCLTKTQKISGLLLFTGLSVLVCVRIVISSFTSPPIPFTVKGIHRSIAITSTGEPCVPVIKGIPEREYRQAVAFHRYMDSLKQSDPGHLLFDSIQHHRPGLLDSALLLEQLYHSSLK